MSTERSRSAASDEPSGGRALPAAEARSEQATSGEGKGPRENRGVVPRLVLFDVGDVIIRATHDITHVILEDYGVPPAIAREYYAHEDYRSFARGTLTGAEFGERTRERVNGRMTVPQLRRAHDAHMYDVDGGTLEVIAALHRRGFPIALVTDTSAWQNVRERELIDLRPFIVQAFRSNEIGMLKGDGGVFEHILAVTGEHPSRVLLIDDSPEKVERAAAVGIPTIQFTAAAALRGELVRLGLLSEPLCS